MELPIPLREAVDAALKGISLSDLTAAAAALSERYRADAIDSRMHLSGDLAVRAYLATRLPATYAAVRASMDSASALLPDYAPRTLCDVGAGPGTALWAACDCWPSIDSAILLEYSAPARAVGKQLPTPHAVSGVVWRDGDATDLLHDAPPADLVTLAYVLGEIAPASRRRLVEQLWAVNRGLLLMVEPGTPSGFARMREARNWLIALGANLIAPCPHAMECPLSPPDWCHFARRVSRSRIHRLAKNADVPWEDEKYIYLAAARQPCRAPRARIIGAPRRTGGRIVRRLCCDDGTAVEQTITRRDATAFAAARRLGWGDAVPERG